MRRSPMKRRDFLKSAGVGAAALSFVPAGTVLAGARGPEPTPPESGGAIGVVGAWTKPFFSSQVGVIGTTETFKATQTFGTPQNLMALPLLRYVRQSSSSSVTEAYISEYVDGGVTHKGKFMAIVATECTKIVWALYCDRSFNNPTRLILYFG